MAGSNGKRPRRITASVGELELDPENPRLVVSPSISQFDLLTKLYEEEALDELVPSFLENGYFEEEPLVVVKAGDKYRVVEGNRRLATLKLLLDSRTRRRADVVGWPTPTPTQRQRLQEIPCILYPSREAVIPFLGYRHITGAKKWAPFQRARFVAQLLETGTDLDHVQEVIGDTTRTTKKLYQDFVVYRQITDELEIDPRPIRDRFSLLEVMLGQSVIKTHLGMPRRLPTAAVEALVDEDHLDELAEVTQWVFGDGSKAPVITDSREISRLLAPVIDNEEALDHLRLTGDLEGAFERTDGEQTYLLRRISAAERALRDTAGLLPLYRDEADVRAAIERVGTLVKSLQGQLRKS